MIRARLSLFSAYCLASAAAALVGFAEMAQATSADPCYGITIQIQSDKTSEADDQKSAKILAAQLRKRYRLASVPPVETLEVRRSDKPLITFHRPTDFSCARSISAQTHEHAHVLVEPQSAGRPELASLGLIKIWWPAKINAVIATLGTEQVSTK